MNLLNKTVEKSDLGLFRLKQYNMHEEFVRCGINYLVKLGLKYDPAIFNPDNYQFSIIEDCIYHSLNHYSVRGLQLKTCNEKNNFLTLNVPIISHGLFYKLNGVYYVPMCYISDEPIVRKEKSVIMSSTFQPITLYFVENRAIFMGINILISDFIKVMSYNWSVELKQIIEANMDIDLTSQSNISSIVSYMSNKLYTQSTIQSIQNRVNELFFDDWTKELYRVFYNIEPTMDNVLKIALRKWIYKERVSFIDLRYKRLTFIEPILRPYFKAVTKAAEMLIKGNQPRSLTIQLDSIVKAFFDDLDGNALYDTVNGFSAILAHQCSMKNPGGKGQLPKEVASIHFTHKGRICTSTISNKDPGQTISLIPDQKIDFRYGMFKFTEEDLKFFESEDNKEKI